MNGRPHGRPVRFKQPVTRSVVLEQTELEALQTLATTEGETVSGLIRRAVLAMLKPKP